MLARADAPQLKSLGVALEVLEVLDGAQELGVSEIARWVGVSKAAAHRMLATFGHRG